MKVAVLKGGSSLERQVSLRSAARVEDALASLGHDVLPIDADSGLVRSLKESRPDVAVIALHGPGGEDGTPQELLEGALRARRAAAAPEGGEQGQEADEQADGAAGRVAQARQQLQAAPAGHHHHHAVHG